MTMLNALNWFREAKAKPANTPDRQLLPADRLDFMIRRERDRADRRGIPFCLLRFSPQAERDNEHHQLVSICLRRVRLTDDVGRLDRKRVAVLLPDTHEQGAWKVAHDISRTFEATTNGVGLEVEVLVYPDARRGIDNRDHSEARPRRHVVPAPQPVDGVPETSSTSRVAGPLEPLLVVATPWWKRAVDICGALFGLVILSPLMCAAAIGVKLSSKGPVFFLQERDGRGGKSFRMFKFRTMVDGAHRQQAQLAAMNEQDGPAFKIERDPRVTWIGRILRDTSLDELPQLLNVLRGDMSLVGPRPLPCGESAACENWQRRRLAVTPGMTCIWQVKDRRNKLPFDEWVRLDLQYIRRLAPLQDAKLLLKTAAMVVFRARWQ
jgi:lipopolysaccharide/colanic/teichoic acid biosynthesis glycosyltransferase